MNQCQALTRDVAFKQVSADAMLANWPYYRERINDAMAQSMRAADCYDEVCEKLADYTAHLVEIEVAGQPRAVAVIDRLDRKDGTALNVWGISGEGMADWLAPFVDYLKAQAQRLEFQYLTCGGRLGWEKALKPTGWTKAAVIMECRI